MGRQDKAHATEACCLVSSTKISAASLAPIFLLDHAKLEPPLQILGY
jgi:hypothetical protein